MKNLHKYFITAMLCLAAFACRKDDTAAPGDVVSALYVRDIFYNEATGQAELNSPENIVETGFLVSDAPDPQPGTAMQYLSDFTTGTRFSSYIVNLTRNTKYYLKAYALDRTGNYSFGRQITFTTSNTILDPVTMGEASIVDGSVTAKTAAVTAAVTNLGGDIRLEEYGAYFWVKDDQSTRRRISVVPPAGENIAANTPFFLPLDSLLADTDYEVQVFARNQRREQKAGVIDLRTQAVGAPSVELLEVRNVTSTTAVVECRVTSDGNDPYFTFGIYSGATSTPGVRTEVKDKVMGEDGCWRFTALALGLQPSTACYFQGWVKNDHSETTSAVDGPHTTLPPGPPTIETVVIVNHEGLGSTTATLRGHVISDGGSALTNYGIRWGAVPGSLTQVQSSDYDPLTGFFSVTLTGLTPASTYYYQAYVTNASGTVNGSEYSFATGVDGGLQWFYDSSGKALYQGGKRLYYFELPPLSVTVKNLKTGASESKTVWLLDRNLGAQEPFPSVSMPNYDQQTIVNWSEKHVGYFYQWGRSVPGLVYRITAGTGGAATQISAGTFVSNSPTLINTIGWVNSMTIIPTDNEWPSSGNPCPAGYRVPNLFEFQGIAKAVAAAGTGNGDWNDVFTHMKLGKTGFRQANGSVGVVNIVEPGASGTSSVESWKNWGALWTATAMKAAGDNRIVTATANVIPTFPVPSGSPWTVNNAALNNAYHFTISEPTSLCGQVGRPYQMDLNYLINPEDQNTFNAVQYYDPWQHYGSPSGNRSQTAGLPVRCARIE